MSAPRPELSEPLSIVGLKAQLSPILGMFPEIAAAYLFGSVARGDARPDSDFDLGLVLRRRGDSALSQHRMLGDLAGRLETIAGGRPLDLVVLEPQGPIFCHRVLIEGRLVYEADRIRRLDFESETISRALDFRPTYEIAAQGKLQAMRVFLGRYR